MAQLTYSFDLALTTVPEPAGVGMMGMVMGAALVRRRRVEAGRITNSHDPQAPRRPLAAPQMQDR